MCLVYLVSLYPELTISYSAGVSLAGYQTFFV
jgi:hypothetical protein